MLVVVEAVVVQVAEVQVVLEVVEQVLHQAEVQELQVLLTQVVEEAVVGTGLVQALVQVVLVSLSSHTLAHKYLQAEL
jgi:hypothetical protein